MKPLFVVVEGGEGVGKTTFVKELACLLASHSPETIPVLTREPGGCAEAEKIREYLLSEEHPRLSEAVLFAKARKVHSRKVITPALNSDSLVLCDRYILSNLVYQGLLYDKESTELVEKLNSSPQIPRPDLTILLTCDAAECRKRMVESHRKMNAYDNRSLEIQSEINHCFDKAFSSDEFDEFIGEKLILDTGEMTAKEASQKAFEYILEKIEE